MPRTEIKIITPYSLVLTPESQVTDMPRLLEIAGRTCYKSEDKITPESNEKFIKMIRDSGHHSVLEHSSITVKIVGDRSMSHQLVRHRIAAYSQESMRYCDYSREKFEGLQVICPPKIAADETIKRRWLDTIEWAYDGYLNLREQGIPAEDARSVLPQATKTEVVTTFNVRQWRHVFEHRALNRRAQWQIRWLMLGILDTLAKTAPILFDDLWEKAIVEDPGGPVSYPCTWALPGPRSYTLPGRAVR